MAKLLAEIISILHEEKSLTEYRGEREMLKYAYLQKIKSLNRSYRFINIGKEDEGIKDYSKLNEV